MKYSLALIILLIGQIANAAMTYEEGQSALLFGDIDGAIVIFENLALLGDKRAGDAAVRLQALSIEEREQYVSQIAAGALKSGNLDEAERLFSLLHEQAAERGDKESVDVFAEVLELVAEAREQVSATMRCETTVIIQSGSISTDAAENCPVDAPASLVEKHREEVAAAWRGLRESGETDGSVLVITENQNPAEN